MGKILLWLQERILFSNIVTPMLATSLTVMFFRIFGWNFVRRFSLSFQGGFVFL
jgi:hypothetical protein